MTDTNSFAVIDRRIRKLQQVREMLADAEIYDIVRSIFEPAPKATALAESNSKQLELPRARRKYQRRGGASFVEQTFEYLQEYKEPTTAKELADYMASRGYRFKAKDRNIAVSKALRQLKDQGRIQSRRGDRPKSPITYWVNVMTPDVESVTEFRDFPMPTEERPH